MINGNERNSIRILQLNTGNGSLAGCLTRILDTIVENDPDIIILSEANVDTYDLGETMKTEEEFKNFKMEYKVLPGSGNARLAILIHKRYEYERCSDMENNVNCTMVLKILRKSKNPLKLVGVYRQWKGTSDMCSYNGKDRLSSLQRFRDLTKIITEVSNLPGETILAGDFNVDRFQPNNPERRNDLKLIIPEFEECLANNDLTLINSKPNHHRHGQRSTLIDLFIASKPLKCSSWKNISNLTSEHEGVICDYNINDALIKGQFRLVRDSRRLNLHNITMRLRDLDFFNPEMNITDINDMTLAVKDKLNQVINILAPTKRIQLKGELNHKRDEESTKLFEEARRTKYEAIRDKDSEKFRKAQNLTAVATRISYKKKAERYMYQM